MVRSSVVDATSVVNSPVRSGGFGSHCMAQRSSFITHQLSFISFLLPSPLSSPVPSANVNSLDAIRRMRLCCRRFKWC